MLSKKEVVDTFVNTPLEEDYNFLEEDLVKIANAFVAVATPKIAKAEREECIEFVRSLNHLVADKLKEKRGHL
jgi:hypothetical protein